MYTGSKNYKPKKTQKALVRYGRENRKEIKNKMRQIQTH